MNINPPKDLAYYQALRALGLSRNGSEPGGTELEALIERYQAPYPDDQRRAWIAARLRAWIAARLRAWAGEEEE